MASRDLLLLGELADALSGVHTLPATGRAFVQAARRHLPLRWFELGKRDPQNKEQSRERERGFLAMLFSPDGQAIAVTQQQRSADEVPVEGDGSTGARRYGRHAAEESGQSLPRFVRRAFASGAGELVALPFLDEGELTGYAVLALSEASPPLEPALIEAIANLLRVAWRHLQLVERVASLSRRAHVETQHLRSELLRAREPERLAAVSAASRRILTLVDLVARHDTTVLLRGESGTGKEVVARRIHRLSSRANRPFLKVNCGALPEGLLESTLFGHEKGAFTGAASQHRGLFERAHGGTLLLDEVAELPPAAQAKLLRVLQEGEVERVGGETTYSVDVRLIAATHQPLEKMLERGTFRSDLYYRLNIFPISLVPLRERGEDIPLLAETLLERLCQRHGRPPPRLTPALLESLGRHSWPGNIRELENLLERALILTTAGEPLVLPPDFMAQGQTARRAASDEVPLRYEAAVRQCIERALQVCRGQIYGPAGAAALLGLKPTTLQSKMRKLGISRSSLG